jgi:hypothetical protein
MLLPEDDLEVAPPAVPALDRSAEAGSEAALLFELGAVLSCQRSIELRLADEAEADEELTQPLAGLRLSRQSPVEGAAINRSLCHQNRPQQGPVAAGAVHVFSPWIFVSSAEPSPGSGRQSKDERRGARRVSLDQVNPSRKGDQPPHHELAQVIEASAA